jgi:hypothetical protein
MADNGNDDDRLWKLLEGLIADGWLIPDALATEAARRLPGLRREEESWQAWLDRVRALLRAKGALDGDGPGATVKAASTEHLKEVAGLGLSLNDVADQLLRATPGHGAAPRACPAPTSAAAALALDDLWRRAEDAAKVDEAAALLIAGLSPAARGEGSPRGR